MTILDEAAAAVDPGEGSRRDEYGSPLEGFSDAAQIWSAVIGTPVTAEQVALCMIGLKISRAKRKYHHDSLVDIAGYARCLEMIESERAERLVG